MRKQQQAREPGTLLSTVSQVHGPAADDQHAARVDCQDQTLHPKPQPACQPIPEVSLDTTEQLPPPPRSDSCLPPHLAKTRLQDWVDAAHDTVVWNGTLAEWQRMVAAGGSLPAPHGEVGCFRGCAQLRVTGGAPQRHPRPAEAPGRFGCQPAHLPCAMRPLITTAALQAAAVVVQTHPALRPAANADRGHLEGRV